MKRILRISLSLAAVGLISGCINVFKLTDIRPNEDNPFSNQEKAKRLMNEMGLAHGISNWDSLQTYTVTFGDEFYGFFGKQGNPFKEDKMEFSLDYVPKTSDGQLEIISGKQKGEHWGIHNWHTYRKNDDGSISEKKNKDMEFWIPTYQYFIELPNRIQEATSIDYIGEKTINGINTEGVIASWNTTEPQKDIDQYILWIDSETKRIVKVEYTVRDFYRFVSGAAYFNEYKEYNGILLPSEMPVESNLVKEGFLHMMSIKEFTANAVLLDSLRPLE